MKVLVTILLLCSVSTFLVDSQNSSEENCFIKIICRSIGDVKWHFKGSHLTCVGDDSIKSEFSDSLVSSVVHKNESEVSNLDEITGLFIFDAEEVKFIPSGLKKHFPILKGLRISSSGLLSVTKEDLKQFGSSLEHLSLFNNNIKSINADLFEYNPNLKAIFLVGNPIRHIDPEFFANLKQLKSLEVVSLSYFGNSGQEFSTSRGHDIATYKWNNENCTDSTAKIQAQNLVRDSSKCSH